MLEIFSFDFGNKKPLCTNVAYDSRDNNLLPPFLSCTGTRNYISDFFVKLKHILIVKKLYKSSLPKYVCKTPI